MDFGIKNPVHGHSSHIDEKSLAWGGFEPDLLAYLSNIEHLEAFADVAQNSTQLAEYLDPFLENAQKHLQALSKLADGQVTWTELRKQFGSKVATAIQQIRKLNADFNAEMERTDAKDRADLLKIDQKREHSLAEIAAQLHHDLESELFRHQSKLGDINARQSVQAQRQSIQAELREKRQALLTRARFGSQVGAQSQIPVQLQDRRNPASSVSATATPRGWGNLGGLWGRLGAR